MKHTHLLLALAVVASFFFASCGGADSATRSAERALTKQYEAEGYKVKDCTLFKTGESEYKGTITYCFTQDQLNNLKKEFEDVSTDEDELAANLIQSVLSFVTDNGESLNKLVGEELTSDVTLLYNGNDLKITSSEFDSATQTKFFSLFFNQFLK